MMPRKWHRKFTSLIFTKGFHQLSERRASLAILEQVIRCSLSCWMLVVAHAPLFFHHLIIFLNMFFVLLRFRLATLQHFFNGFLYLLIITSSTPVPTCWLRISVWSFSNFLPSEFQRQTVWIEGDIWSLTTWTKILQPCRNTDFQNRRFVEGAQRLTARTGFQN